MATIWACSCRRRSPLPLGTYTGWNLRRKQAGADGALTSLQGSFIPFPIVEKSADPRPTVQKRYADVKIYRGDLDDAAVRLIEDRYLLAEDRDRYLAYGTALWDFVMKR